MQKITSIITTFFLSAAFAGMAQTVDTEALKPFDASTVRATYEVCRHVSLTPEQQVKLAKQIERENVDFLKEISKNSGFLSAKANKKLQKAHDAALADILDGEQLEQYYRGVYNAEALAEGNGIADRLQKQYSLTDQNWKFIRNAFYRIGLDTRVLKKTMASNPKAQAAEIKRRRSAQLQEIEDRGGIRVNPDMTVTVVRPFDPNSLRKE